MAVCRGRECVIDQVVSNVSPTVKITYVVSGDTEITDLSSVYVTEKERAEFYKNNNVDLNLMSKEQDRQVKSERKAREMAQKDTDKKAKRVAEGKTPVPAPEEVVVEEKVVKSKTEATNM